MIFLQYALYFIYIYIINKYVKLFYDINSYPDYDKIFDFINFIYNKYLIYMKNILYS